MALPAGVIYEGEGLYVQAYKFSISITIHVLIFFNSKIGVLNVSLFC